MPQPDGFDSPERLDAFLNAVRWGAVSSADMRALQAPFRSGIEIEDYQVDPLVRAIQELIVRNRACSVLIVCSRRISGYSAVL